MISIKTSSLQVIILGVMVFLATTAMNHLVISSPVKSNSKELRLAEVNLSMELRQHKQLHGNSDKNLYHGGGDFMRSDLNVPMRSNSVNFVGKAGIGKGLAQKVRPYRSNPFVKQIKRDLTSQDEYEDTLPNAERMIYPMLISKKSATALNKLIYALKTSLDSASVEKQQDSQAAGVIPYVTTSFKSIRDVQPIQNSNFNYDPYNQHLQRRGQQKDRKNYLRCYFNAVSCF